MADVGEFGFIDEIKRHFVSSNSKKVTVPLGDDCFCFKAGNENICVTKDMLVEGVHFKKEWTTAKELGAKAVEVNVSDIVSMGDAKPKYLFAGIGLPSDTDYEHVKQLYAGIKSACKKYGIIISGGDTVRSDKIIISITLVGVTGKNVITRSGAKAGDFIGVTNTFGDAGAGVVLLYKHGAKHKFNANEKFLISRQNSPKARLKEASVISKYATSMTDASDGLDVSIKLIAAKGADIELSEVPLSKSLKAEFDKNEQLKYALFGMEDFELVFTVPPAKIKDIVKLLPNVSFIGRITNSKKVKYFYNGKEQKIKPSGFKHF